MLLFSKFILLVGTRDTRAPAGDGKAIKFKATFTPALNIEYLLTEMFEACNRKNAKDPSPFDACYVLRQTKGEYYLGDVPVFIQQTIFPMMAVLGKVFGIVKAKRCLGPTKKNIEEVRSGALV